MTPAAARRPDRDPVLWDTERFLAFYSERPEGEHWQLIDGLPMMMVPPNLRHQTISKNIFLALNKALVRYRSDLAVYWEMGIRIPGRDDFNPEPDLLVFRADADFDRYADEFFLVAEVMSPSNTAEMIERKIELYRTHPRNLYVLVIEQESVSVRLYAREADWAVVNLRSLDDTLSLPAFGLTMKLEDIYLGTPLAKRPEP